MRARSIRPRLAIEFGSLGRSSCRSRRQRMDWVIQCHQLQARHPQVRQREQRLQLGGVLEQPSVAHLRVPELPLDDSERVLDLRAYAGLERLDLVENRAELCTRLQPSAIAWPHGDMPR